MKLLIITSFYPPDTTIAAVRPYMLAKYLTQYGHDVTVLRSGLLLQSADRTLSNHAGTRVITYLGENSPSVQFERGDADFLPVTPPVGKSRIAFLPEPLRKRIAKVYHTLMAPYRFYCWYKKDFWQNRFVPMKAALDQMAGEHFDVVFSTYGDIENIWGGEYAAKLFGAVWVQDFRDPMEPHAPSKIGRPFLKRIQKNAVRNSDLCTAVSEDLAKHLSMQAGGKTVHTIYNGYAPNDEDIANAVPEKDSLSFCYTGQLYAGLRDFTPLLEAICLLKASGKISLDKIRIHYAGNDFPCLQQLGEKLGISEVLVDHGYVGRKDAAKMQAQSDVYVVLSWNTKTSKGVLTGKFYEGIRAKKPILSIINGDVPQSELSVINEKYHYGFCYEKCREDQPIQALCDYIEGLYREKMSTGSISYAPDPNLITDFRYDTLSKKLETLCLEALGQ